jgi:hypothetical protein
MERAWENIFFSNAAFLVQDEEKTGLPYRVE